MLAKVAAHRSSTDWQVNARLLPPLTLKEALLLSQRLQADCRTGSNTNPRKSPCAPERVLALRERTSDPKSLEIDAVWDREWERHLAEMARARVQQQVSATQFQIFELYVVQAWPVREVARMLGISAGQVYLAKHRVSRLLKKEVNKLRRT